MRLPPSCLRAYSAISTILMGETVRSILETLFALTSVPVLALMGLFAFRHDPAFFNEHVVSIVVCSFCLAIAFYHLYFYSKREKNTKHLTRHIDYSYLIYSFFGLLFAATSFQHQNDAEYKKEVVEQARRYLQALPGKYEQEYKLCDKPNNTSKLCSELEELRQEASNGDSLLGDSHSGLIYNVVIIFTRVKSIEKQISVFIKHDYEYEDDPENILGLANELGGLRETFASNDRDRRDLGYYLLAVAIALRITRVTLERFPSCFSPSSNVGRSATLMEPDPSP